jgi:hypothetical protein
MEAAPYQHCVRKTGPDDVSSHCHYHGFRCHVDASYSSPSIMVLASVDPFLAKWTHHLINFLPDGALRIVDSLAGSDEADFALDISTRRLRYVDLAASLGLHRLDGFATYRLLVLQMREVQSIAYLCQ